MADICPRCRRRRGNHAPQLPQFFASVCRSTQDEPQCVKFALHETPHAKPASDALHVAAPFVGVAQVLPQPPQLSRSFVRHPPSQASSIEGQTDGIGPRRVATPASGRGQRRRTGGRPSRRRPRATCPLRARRGSDWPRCSCCRLNPPAALASGVWLAVKSPLPLQAMAGARRRRTAGRTRFREESCVYMGADCPGLWSR